MPKMPSGMRKRPDGGYEYRFTVKGRRYSVYGKSVRECTEKTEKRRREIETGVKREGRVLTLDEYFLRWEGARTGAVRDSTLRTDRYIYRIAADMGTDGTSTRFGAQGGSVGHPGAAAEKRRLLRQCRRGG